MKILKVLVKKDDIYYQCKLWENGNWHCGRCDWGVIDPYFEKYTYPAQMRCKVCGADFARVNYLEQEIPYDQYSTYKHLPLVPWKIEKSFSW